MSASIAKEMLSTPMMSIAMPALTPADPRSFLSVARIEASIPDPSRPVLEHHVGVEPSPDDVAADRRLGDDRDADPPDVVRLVLVAERQGEGRARVLRRARAAGGGARPRG